MSRVLIIVAAVLVFFWLLRRALGSRGGQGKDAEPGPAKKGEAPVSDLVACAQCGVNLPVAEAVVSAGEAPRYYCCEAHRRLGPR
jgi:uncharacterized protein